MTSSNLGSSTTPTIHFMKLTLFVQLAPELTTSDAVTLILKRLNTFVTNAQAVVLGFEAEEALPKDLTKSLQASHKKGKKIV
jgi:hypothetical protein